MAPHGRDGKGEWHVVWHGRHPLITPLVFRHCISQREAGDAGYRPRGRRANPPPLEARRYGVGAWEAEPCKVQLSCVVLEQEEAADEAGGADLKYLLARQGVKIENQRIFFHHGITTVEKLVSLAKDREDLVQALKDHWDLDQTPSLTERAQVAAIACAFSNASSRSQKAAEVDAEQEGPR